jgi:EF hand
MKLKLRLLAIITATFSAVVLESNPNDLNRDKRISWQEFETFQQSEAKNNTRKFDPQQAKHLVEDKDTDGDGFLSYLELAKPAQ